MEWQMIDNLFSIKQQIKKAIQYWKFDLAEYI